MKKQYIVFIIGLILIVTSSIISVQAATYLFSSSEVSYSNSSSGLSSTTVQGAIDELATKANNYASISSRITTFENNHYAAKKVITDCNDAYVPGVSYQIQGGDVRTTHCTESGHWLEVVAYGLNGNTNKSKVQFAFDLNTTNARVHFRSSNSSGNFSAWRRLTP